MAETQKSIGDWAKQTFPGGDDLAPRHVLRLLEEVVELAFAVGANRDDILASVGDSLESQRLKTGRAYGALPRIPRQDRR